MTSLQQGKSKDGCVSIRGALARAASIGNVSAEGVLIEDAGYSRKVRAVAALVAALVLSLCMLGAVFSFAPLNPAWADEAGGNASANNAAANGSGASASASSTPEEEGARTKTLSGSIGDTIINESVRRVILDGVSAEPGTKISIRGANVVVQVKEGTQNAVASLEAMGNLTVEGSGNLSATFLYASGAAVFNITGAITISDGSITTLAGDLTINSGTYTISSNEESGYSLASLGGNIVLNGGTLTLHGRVSAIHSNGGAVVLAGGSLDASSDGGAVVLGGKNMSNAVIIGPGMQFGDGIVAIDTIDEKGNTYTLLVGKDGEPVSTIKGEGPAVEPGTVTAASAVKVEADKDKAAEIKNSQSFNIAAMALVAFFVGVPLVAAFFVVRAKKKKAKA